MTVVKIADFEAWHLQMMDVRGEMAGPEFNSRASMAAANGPCITVFADDKPIVSIGIAIVCRGTAEIWVVACTDIGKYKKTLCKTSKWALEEAKRRFGIYRFQAAIDKDKIMQRKWAEFMGMKVEGPAMHRFGPDGETYMRYVLFM